MAVIHDLRQALADAEAKRSDFSKTMVETAEAGGEAYDSAVKSFDGAEKEVGDIKAKIARVEDAEAKAAAAAVVSKAPEGSLAPATVKADSALVKKAPLAKMIGGMMEKHTGGAMSSDTFIKTAYGDDMAAIVKTTHQVTDYATGGALSLPDFAGTIIDGLENMTMIRRMQPQVLNVPGSLILPKETSAPSGSWLPENAAPTAGNFTFGDIRLDPKRLAIEAVISRKLLDVAARGGAAVRNLEGFVVRRLQERTAINEDAGYYRGSGTGNVPLGIRNQVNAANVKAIAGTSAANIESDLRSRVTKLQEANVMVTAGYWTMAPRTRAALADLRDANGNKIYPSIDANNTLLGYSIIMSNQVPINLGGGTESEIVFVNGPSIIIANGTDASVTVSTEGGYTDANGVAQFLTSNNEMLIHLEMDGDVKMERDTAISVLTGVSY